MTVRDDSRAHLAKAREFLAAARSNLDLEMVNAATSGAVISGINSKDAVCLRLTGMTRKAVDHSDAVAELTAAGPAGAALAPTLSRLLKLKTRSQYQSASVAEADATRAVAWAARLLEGAETVVSSR
jgi:cobalamin-dependent methionine synthase I